MTRMRTAVLLVVGMMVAALAIAAPASARDRNHDNLPDRWETKYDLSLKVKQNKRDQDKDGLNNRGEYEAGTNPRQDDTDDDGSMDGDENAGTITAFDGTTLTIELFGGGTVTGTVDENTEIKCGNACGHDGDDGTDDQGPGDQRRFPGPGHDGTGGPDNSGPGSFGGHHGPEGEDGGCTVDDLTVGAVIREAELHLKNGSAVFDEIELADDPAETTPTE